MLFPRRALVLVLLLAGGDVGICQELGAARVTPNLVSNIDRPLRYRPDHGDFVIINGQESFNRPLYGGNTAFRVDGGDKPEFVLYLPGRGGNVRLGVRSGTQAKWLQECAKIETRYRPGELRYAIHDPILGRDGELDVVAVAYADAEGLGLRVEAHHLAPRLELVWGFGGVNRQRGKRDGDIGTESVPISEWFQLRPEFCHGNRISTAQQNFELRASAATIVGLVSKPASISMGDARNWNDASAMFETPGVSIASGTAPAAPVVVGRAPLANAESLYLSFERRGQTATSDLDVYREVTAPALAAAENGAPTESNSRQSAASTVPVADRAPPDLPTRFAEAERHFAALRARVTVDTPDDYFNAAVGALNVAADAVWDEPQRAIMHGAIAWRTRLLGWRGPYALDALGWHDRFEENARYWFGRQNTAPISPGVPPPDEKANLARNEAGLHSNGDMSNSHYDMNLVFIDAVFRHLQWTGNMAFARDAWPVIERHLAWERRLFRREFGAEKLPLYEAYAAIWASDDLQYSGGGAMHASAYNYYENRQAARLARLLGKDPAPYDHEANLIARAVRKLLWVSAADATREGMNIGANLRPASRNPDSFGWFAENKDWLGRQRVHPSAALWTFYHTMDSEVPTPTEAWQMADYVDVEIPHLPVRGPGVPERLCTLATTNWMPYDWSINNVVMAEAIHGALGLWQAGRPDEAWSVLKGSVLASMFMGISPGNVGSMSYLDVYRRESQRDFADGSGALSRAVVEGVFGVKCDALAGELRITPGWPQTWGHARIVHPDFSLAYFRAAAVDRYVVEEFETSRAAAPPRARPLALRLRVIARTDRIDEVLVNGKVAPWQVVEDSVGAPRVEIVCGPATRFDVAIHWAGEPIAIRHEFARSGRFRPVEQGSMRWLEPELSPRKASAAGSDSIIGRNASAHGVDTGDRPAIDVTSAQFQPVDLAPFFNDRITHLFRQEYRTPRSPFVSLALPKQGIGGWAGGVNRTADIDDSGLHNIAAQHGGRIVLPNGVPLAIPSESLGRDVVFTSRWSNYPREITIPLAGTARAICLLMAGSTNPMQSRFENGEVVVNYTDGSASRLPLINPATWWPIEQDYFVDDFQFPLTEPLPIRIDLRSGRIRDLSKRPFKGQGGPIPGGAATVFSLPLDGTKTLKSLVLRATANDVVVGLMAATLMR